MNDEARHSPFCCGQDEQQQQLQLCMFCCSQVFCHSARLVPFPHMVHVWKR
jgi:hypothetical protein